MKRKIVRTIIWIWLIVCVGAGLFVLIGWLTIPTGEPFWRMAKGLTADVALITASVRYLQTHPRTRKEIEDEV
jgi:hypothetical protein